MKKTEIHRPGDGERGAAVGAATGGRWNRATAVLFALAAGLSLVYGMLMLSTSGRAGGGAEQGDVALISQRGERVDVTRHLAAGKYTVIDFYADWCIQCREVTPYLESLARSRPDFAVRKVNIVAWETPVVAQYRITHLPYLQMYTPSGALLADGADRVLAELKRRFPGS